jgi:hypothetical protein
MLDWSLEKVWALCWRCQRLAKPGMSRGTVKVPMLGCKSDAWIQLSSGNATSVFLAFDFDLTSRSEATFRDLVRMFPAPLTVLQATQPPESFSTALPAARYLDWWREGIACVDVRISAILGYCAGSVFASAMADELEVCQEARPTVVLFNPGKPTVVTLERDFRAIIAGMSSLTATEQAAAYQEVSILVQGSYAEFPRTADEMMLIYARLCKMVFARLNIHDDAGEALLGVFRSYLSYLSAARQLKCGVAWPAAVALNSSERDEDTNFTRSKIPFPVSRSDLLRTREVAQITYDLLTSGA